MTFYEQDFIRYNFYFDVKMWYHKEKKNLEPVVTYQATNIITQLAN